MSIAACISRKGGMRSPSVIMWTFVNVTNFVAFLCLAHVEIWSIVSALFREEIGIPRTLNDRWLDWPSSSI